jgi:preprotein translocase subunit SecF
MRIVRFSKGFLPAIIISSVIIVVGLIAFLKDGFNFGVDFSAGLIQEVQFAPPAFSLTYAGPGNASVSMSRNQLDIVVSGAAVDNTAYAFPFAQYSTIGSLTGGLSLIEGLTVDSSAAGDVPVAHLIQSSRGNPALGTTPYIVHYLPPGSPAIPIDEVRAALDPLGTASVQVLGNAEERRFMIRLEDNASAAVSAEAALVEANNADEAVPAEAASDETASAETVPTEVAQAETTPAETASAEAVRAEAAPAEAVIAALESVFGDNAVAVTRSDYVGSRFSKQLQNQAGLLFLATLVLILAYAAIRFKIEYALGAVIAIAHDALVMVTFICLTRMEFNTTTIAALLTILGYSINDTIVIFDRIRESQRVYPDDSFEHILNRSISETLGRTIITTVTTMLAVLSLFIFTTGSMKDFALAMLIGMISGVYSTIFIASAFVYYWKRRKPSVKIKKTAPVAA